MHRRYHMFRFIGNARVCRGITAVAFSARGIAYLSLSHGLLWIVIVLAVLLISRELPSSGLLRSLCIYLCSWPSKPQCLNISSRLYTAQGVVLLLLFNHLRCQSSRVTSRGTALPTCQGYLRRCPRQKRTQTLNVHDLASHPRAVHERSE